MLAIADNVDPTSLNPLLAHDQDTIGYDLLVTQTLVGLSAENRLVPVLVTRVPSRANGDVSIRPSLSGTTAARSATIRPPWRENSRRAGGGAARATGAEAAFA